MENFRGSHDFQGQGRGYSVIAQSKKKGRGHRKLTANYLPGRGDHEIIRGPY